MNRPSRALRFKKDSSMRVAINLVKDGTAQACVSAGNTGALMATARYVLKTLPGIDRPAISSAIPSIDGFTEVLDLGANVDCSAEHLFQFAVMGSVLARRCMIWTIPASACSTSVKKRSRATIRSKKRHVCSRQFSELHRLTSKATTSTKAVSMWWCAMASSAMWR